MNCQCVNYQLMTSLGNIQYIHVHDKSSRQLNGSNPPPALWTQIYKPRIRNKPPGKGLKRHTSFYSGAFHWSCKCIQECCTAYWNTCSLRTALNGRLHSAAQADLNDFKSQIHCWNRETTNPPLTPQVEAQRQASVLLASSNRIF